MKAIICAVIALACVVGLAMANYGGYSYMPLYGSGYGSRGGSGFGNGGCKYIQFFTTIFIVPRSQMRIMAFCTEAKIKITEPLVYAHWIAKNFIFLLADT